MTLAEFKAWFEGYSEHIAEQPTPEQWKRVKAKVSALSTSAQLYGQIGIRNQGPNHLLGGSNQTQCIS